MGDSIHGKICKLAGAKHFSEVARLPPHLFDPMFSLTDG
jgi:hypothetical protein